MAQNISRKKWLGAIFIALAAVTAGRFIWYEYYQLFALKRDVAYTLFGVMLALVHIGNLLGAEFAHRTKSPIASYLYFSSSVSLALKPPQ